MKFFSALVGATVVAFANLGAALDCYVGEFTSPAGNCPASEPTCFQVTTTMNVSACDDDLHDTCMLSKSDARPMDGALTVTGSCVAKATCDAAVADAGSKSNGGQTVTVECHQFGVAKQTDSYLTEATVKLARDNSPLSTCFVGTESRSARRLADGFEVSAGMKAQACEAGQACQMLTKDSRPVDGPVTYVGSCASTTDCQALTPAQGETKMCYNGVQYNGAVQMKVGIDSNPKTDTVVRMQGYVTDILCWNQPEHKAFDGAMLTTEPSKHTIHCMLDMPTCLQSGFGLLAASSTTGEYKLAYTFDAAGNEKAVELMKGMREGATPQKDSVFVDVEGTVQQAADGTSVLSLTHIAPGARACTMEAKMCPDGSPARRNPDCSWQPCEGPTGCTEEAKMCPDGSMAGRNADCSWQPCDDDSVSGQGMCFVGVETTTSGQMGDPETTTTMEKKECKTSCKMTKVDNRPMDGNLIYTGECLSEGASCAPADDIDCYSDITTAQHKPKILESVDPTPDPTDGGRASSATATMALLIATVAAVASLVC